VPAGGATREHSKGKTKKEIMETYKVPVRTRGLGIASVLFGLLGGVFAWWTSLGMVLSLTGLVMGFVGWTMARRMSTGFGLSVVGMLLSLATLILDSVIAARGLELIRLHTLR
jgi:hypothetical protein